LQARIVRKCGDVAQLGEPEKEIHPVNELDAILPCIAPYRQLKLSKFVPDKFFPASARAADARAGFYRKLINHAMDGRL